MECDAETSCGESNSYRFGNAKNISSGLFGVGKDKQRDLAGTKPLKILRRSKKVNAKKVQIDKSWLDQPAKNKNAYSNVRKLHKFENMVVTKSEDLPDLMTTKEAAELLRRHPDTIKEYRNDGDLKFIKIKGRYFTTPEYIADFLEREMKKR